MQQRQGPIWCRRPACSIPGRWRIRDGESALLGRLMKGGIYVPLSAFERCVKLKSGQFAQPDLGIRSASFQTESICLSAKMVSEESREAMRIWSQRQVRIL